MMQVTAVTLMNDIIQRYQLTPFNKVGPEQLGKARIVVATRHAVYGYDLNDLATSIFTSEVTPTETIYALTTIPTPAGNRIAFTTSRGQLYILDEQGDQTKCRQVSQMPIWSIAQAQVSQRILLFATCADCTIRVCDMQGVLLGTIETPGRILSLSVQELEGQTFFLGGVQGKNHVYVWYLQQMLQRQDAAPMAILQGGRKPAFATTFFKWNGDLWLAHGCWDNHIYLYRWPNSNALNPVAPTLALECSSPIYPIQAISIAQIPHLLVGTEEGELYSWPLSRNLEAIPSPKITTRFSSRITCLTVCPMGEGGWVLVGDKDSRLSVFQLTDTNSLETIAVLTLDGSETIGAGIV